MMSPEAELAQFHEIMQIITQCAPGLLLELAVCYTKFYSAASSQGGFCQSEALALPGMAE